VIAAAAAAASIAKREKRELTIREKALHVAPISDTYRRIKLNGENISLSLLKKLFLVFIPSSSSSLL
jgi:hypothetical protein